MNGDMRPSPPLERDDLDGLLDDETLVEDPDIRRAKALLVILILSLVSAFILVLILFFQPEGQILVERWPNGYRRTQTTYVGAPNPEGRIPHGPHRAWHGNGTLAEEGEYEGGQPVGIWSYWDAQGQPSTSPVDLQP